MCFLEYIVGQRIVCKQHVGRLPILSTMLRLSIFIINNIIFREDLSYVIIGPGIKAPNYWAPFLPKINIIIKIDKT